MKKITVFMAVLVFLSGAVMQAAPVSMDEAKKKAQSFYNGARFAQRTAKSTADFVCEYPAAVAKSDNAFVPYYIFNVEGGNGWVIVAGDDNAGHILAYSSEGRFDYNAMPANVNYWLDFYADGVENASRAPKVLGDNDGPYQGGTPVVKPLLGPIAYDQEYPYNNMTPMVGSAHLYTGCAATALVCICKYFGYPAKGRGSISYTPAILYGNQLGLGVLSANFEEHTYDWENTLPSYRKGIEFTDKQAENIALIMRDAGYAMKMDYERYASGAVIKDVLTGAVSHLRYDSAAGLRFRDFYDGEKEWEDMLKRMLDEGNPILYTGQTPPPNPGGHAFVFDGYDDGDFFHVHWGWGDNPELPKYDGYYKANVVKPAEPGQGGIGASSGSGGYTDHQYIVYNLVPEGAGKRMKDAFKVDTRSTMECPELIGEDNPELEEINMTFDDWVNWSAADFKGKAALALYKDGSFYKLVSPEYILSLKGILNMSAEVVSQKASVKIRANAQDVEDGDYDLRVVTKSNMEGCDWVYANCKRSGVTGESYLPVTVVNGKFKHRNVESVLHFTAECALKNRNLKCWVFRDNSLVSGTISAGVGRATDIRLITGVPYTIKFHMSGFDTTTVDLAISKDTAITVWIHETMKPPFINAVNVVDGNTIRLKWFKQAPNTKPAVYPSEYILYLDGEAVATAEPYEGPFGTYDFENVSGGDHVVGIRSHYVMDTTELVAKKVMVASSENVFEHACRLSPNPSFDGVFNLEVPAACTAEVCNPVGQTVKKVYLGSAGKHTLNLGGFAPGMYFVRLLGDRGERGVLKATIR